VRASEYVSLAYFAGLTVVAWIRPLPRDRRFQITVAGVFMCAFLGASARWGSPFWRDWAPLVSILVGYYMSGRFFVSPSSRLERWLADLDRRWLGDPTTKFATWPRPVLAYLEVVYMCTFLLPPAGMAALAVAGQSPLADHYWTMVIGAEFGAFAPLSLIQTRPPWALEPDVRLSDRGIHRFATEIVQRFTTRANTFPSGHVAGSLAVAVGVFAAQPQTGLVFLILALSISLACVIGRYHYVVDVFAGGLLMLVVWLVVTALGI
jgi:membrane-associated phospholipid phosphatase